MCPPNCPSFPQSQHSTLAFPDKRQYKLSPKHLGEAKDRSVWLGECVLLWLLVGSEIFQPGRYQCNRKIIIVLDEQMAATQLSPRQYSQFNGVPGEVGWNLRHLAVLAEEDPVRAMTEPVMTSSS